MYDNESAYEYWLCMHFRTTLPKTHNILQACSSAALSKRDNALSKKAFIKMHDEVKIPNQHFI